MREQERAAPGPGTTVVAIDVGGTSIKGALVDAVFRMTAEVRRPTPRGAGPDAVATAIDAMLAELVNRGPVAAAGIVVPGIVDEAAGIARYSANLGWRDLPLAAQLAARVGLPVALGHDVRGGALAELRIGAGKDAAGMLFLPLGYGIAGAIVADGRLLTSAGYAGEIGHLQVEPGGDRCNCGQIGCLETVASAASVGRRYARKAGLPAPVGAHEVAAAVRRGDDPHAQAAWDEAVAALADAITTVNAVVAPDVVVIGGGLSLAGDLLLDPLRAAVQARAIFLPLPRIVPAELGDRAGALGAAMLAFDLLATQGAR